MSTKMTSAMEFTNEYSTSPQMGSWLSEEFDQDFCYGAKVSTFQSPVLSTPPSIFSDKNEESLFNINWTGFSPLETFSDVILPEKGNFYSDDLFDDIAEEDDTLNHLGLTPNPYFVLSPQTIVPNPSPPKVKIKLRRIKKLKGSKKLTKNIYSQHLNNKLEFEVIKPIVGINSEELHQPQELYPPHELCQPLELCQPREPGDFLVQDDLSYFNGSFKHECLSPDLEERLLFGSSPVESINDPLNQFKNDDFEDRVAFELSPAPTDETVGLSASSEGSLSPVVSLRDAIDMGEADHLLDKLLNSFDATCSNELVLLDSQNSHVISQLQNSPSSPASECSFLPSPQCDSSSYMEFSPETDSPLYSPSFELEENHLDNNEKYSSRRKSSTKQKQSKESRYLKKKEQNKQAALRYRLKKKQEDSSLSQILQNEEEKQEKLTKDYSNLKQEIDIMKKLLREAFIAKKLVPENFFSRKI